MQSLTRFLFLVSLVVFTACTESRLTVAPAPSMGAGSTGPQTPQSKEDNVDGDDKGFDQGTPQNKDQTEQVPDVPEIPVQTEPIEADQQEWVTSLFREATLTCRLQIEQGTRVSPGTPVSDEVSWDLLQNYSDGHVLNLRGQTRNGSLAVEIEITEMRFLQRTPSDPRELVLMSEVKTQETRDARSRHHTTETGRGQQMIIANQDTVILSRETEGRGRLQSKTHSSVRCYLSTTHF